MAGCLLVDGGTGQTSITLTEPNSCTGYILMTSTEYSLMSSPFNDFDTEAFSIMFGTLCVLFLMGYGAGFVARKLGR